MIQLTMNCQIANHTLEIPLFIANSFECNPDWADEPLWVVDEGRMYYSGNYMSWWLRQNGFEPTDYLMDDVINQLVEEMEGMRAG